MLGVLGWFVIFVVSMAVLAKSSDWFTESAEAVGLKLGLSSFIIGVTIVAIGTSLPELVSSLIAMVYGHPDIITGNVVGSNITNILLVLGVAALVGNKIKITHEITNVDLPFFMGSAFFLLITFQDGTFSPVEGLLGLAMIAAYIVYAVRSRSGPKVGTRFNKYTAIFLVISPVLIYVSADWTVRSVVALSSLLNIGKDVITVTAVALGTSLPELMVSLVATKKGKSEVAVGNVLGSNIFNSLAVMGLPSLMGYIPISQRIFSFGLPMMIVSTFTYFFITYTREISKWEGAMLVIMYLLFLLEILAL